VLSYGCIYFMKNLEFAWQLIINPSIAFQSLKEKPNFWFPLLTISIISGAMLAWFYAVVDFDWLREQIVSSNPQFEKMSEAQRAKAVTMIPKGVMMWSSIIGALVVLPVIRFLEAVYYFLIGKMTRVEVGLDQWFSLACWSGFPAIIALLLMGVAIVIRSSAQMTPDAISMLSLNELFFHVPMGHKWHSLLSSLTIVNPYIWWLTIVGVKVFSARSMTYAAVVVLVPLTVIYASWALFASLF
jgi:Yip1 domain